MDKLTKIRKDIYDYLALEGLELTPERHKTLKNLIKNHDEKTKENLDSTLAAFQSLSQKIASVKDKINQFLLKANQDKTSSSRIIGSKEALEMCKRWLSK